MNNDKNQNNIRDYFSGELSKADAKALLQRGASSKELADDIQFSRKLVQALTYEEQLGVAAIIAGVVQAPPVAPPSAAGGWRWFQWSLAFVAVVGIALGGYFIGQQQHWWDTAAQKLAQPYLQPLENVLFTEQTAESARPLQRGMKAYDQGDYTAAIRLLEPYFEKRKDANAGLFLGVSYQLAGQPTEAIRVLGVVAEQLPPPADEAALWHLALAHLQNNDPDWARITLRRLPDTGLYGAQKQELMTQLGQK